MISLSIPWLPPSSNHAYINNGFGGRKLSAEGKKFKLETTAFFVRRYPNALRFFEKDEPYAVYVRFYFKDLENKGWPKKTPTRYKQQDATNRIKLLEDALKDAAGVDDSQNLLFLAEKRYGEEEKTEVFVWSLNKESTPFDGLLELRLEPVQPHRALPAMPTSRAPSPSLRPAGAARRATRGHR